MERSEVRFELPINPRSGRVSWTQNPAFITWFKANAPNYTDEELCGVIGTVTNVSGVTKRAMNSLRGSLRALMTPETRRRAFDRALPVPQRLRTLGPEDKDFFVEVAGDTIVSSDWHVPYHDERLVDQLCLVAKQLKIKNLVINGDFLNEDAFSKWNGHPFHTPWAAEKEIAHELVRRLCQTFGTIYYILDNHDRRIMWAHERPGQFNEHDIVDLIADRVQQKQIRASVYYHYVIINDTWRVTSPKGYRSMKLSLPNRLAQMYHMNVISGGDHLFGMGFDDSGKYVIANNCCMVNQREVPYVMTQDTTYPHWNRGFYVIKDNVLYPFVDHPLLWPRWWEPKTSKRSASPSLSAHSSGPISSPS